MYSLEEHTFHCLTCDLRCEPIYAQFKCNSIDCDGFQSFGGTSYSNDDETDWFEKGQKILQKLLSKISDERPKSNIILIGPDSGDKLDFLNIMNHTAKKVTNPEDEIEEILDICNDISIKFSEHLYRFFDSPSLPTTFSKIIENGPLKMDAIVVLLKGEDLDDFEELLKQICLEVRFKTLLTCLHKRMIFNHVYARHLIDIHKHYFIIF